MPERGVSPPAVSFEELYGGQIARLASPDGSAVVALKGAQVLSWIPAHSEEVFWLSPMVDLAAQKPVRGGIPVCWPWFGVHPNVRLGAHGYLGERFGEH
jgi:glucose-6-phosphate 1-epimerase